MFQFVLAVSCMRGSVFAAVMPGSITFFLVIDLIHHPSMSEQSIRDLCTSTSTRTTMPSSEVLRRDGGGRDGGGGGNEAAEASKAAEAAEAGVALVSSAR